MAAVLLTSSALCILVGGGFFGQNVEIFIGSDVDSEHLGTLCAYGPASDPQSEYVIHCFSGAMSGRVVTIKNRFSASLKLCDVQVLGEYRVFAVLVFSSGPVSLGLSSGLMHVFCIFFLTKVHFVLVFSYFLVVVSLVDIMLYDLGKQILNRLFSVLYSMLLMKGIAQLAVCYHLQSY